MKPVLRRYFVIPFLLSLGACNNAEEKLDGGYEILSAYNSNSSLSLNDTSLYHNIRIFKNGYWVSTSVTPEFVLNSSGGTYKIINGDCIEKFNFNSSDTSVIGKEYSFKYYFAADHLIISLDSSGIITKEKNKIVYKRPEFSEAVKNTFLEGVWIMKPGQGGYNTNNDEVIRIFTYPFFIRTIYNTKEKKRVATYIGTYQFDGKNLAETIKYSSYDITLGSTIEWDVKKLPNNEIQLFDIDSQYDEEIYAKSNNP